MIDRLLQSHLEPIARDSYRWRLWRSLAKCWAALGLIGLAAFALQHSGQWSSPLTFFVLILAGIVAAVIVTRQYRRMPLDYRAVARQIEEENPELHALLLTAVEQVPLQPSGELNYLQQRVILEALEHHRRSPWAGSMARRNQSARQAHWLALLLFVLVLAGLRPHFSLHGGGLWASAERSNGVSVTPGDTTLERGSPLVVLARFDGWLPAGAELVINPVNENERRITLTKNLADPVFGGGVAGVKGDLQYRIEYPGGKTRDFKVSVFDYPNLDHADAKVTYPAYTGLPEKTIKDTRRVSAVEGSSLAYSFFLNKPVTSAKLVAKDQSVVPLVTDTNNATVYHTQIKLDQSRRYELVLVDDAGRTNKLPPEFVLEALKHRPAELKLASPRGDQRVSALEEIAFSGEASDDFGLRSYGIAYSLADGETKTVELGQKTAPREKRAFNYTLPLESLGAQPDQLLSYYIWADDAGPDGETRRVTSDMFFAEIKPFDEIFREAQSPDAGGDQNGNNNNNNNNNQGGQQGSPNERLTQLEKDIISATWNLKRRETDPKPSQKFKDDVQVIHDSQEQALDQVRQQAEQNDDPRLKTFIDTAQKQMDQAATHLADTADKNSLTPLSSAVTEEQSAYQALLKLSAREYQVARANRNQQRGQQQQRGQRAQRQLDQLDLRQTANRYETQRDATAQQQQQTQQQREQLQVTSRLKELAQRQQDLNERLRELQASLQEARTEQERQSIQDRLKTLREQQQDLLADVDELRQRMDRPENQANMSDERQQLDQTRSEVQNAAQSLAQNAVPQALTSGTRAQRDLQQLQDDFRKKNSGQFTDAMRQMRDDARRLAQNQEDIEKKLNEMSAPNQRTLTETDEQRKQRTDLADRLEQQKNGVTNLLGGMRQVSEQSETAEPVLSQQLYDTVRSTSEETLNKALDSSSELVRHGFVPQAGPIEEQARQNIEDLKRNVERAADSVLGDGTEALRLAQRELDDLARQLNQGPDDTNGAAGRGRGTNGVGQMASNQPGGRRNGQANRGGNQPGQPQDGQDAANGQPGQDQNQQANAGGNRQGGQRNGQANRGGNQQGQPQNGQQPGDGQPGQDQNQQANAGGGRQGGQRNGQANRGGNQQGQPQSDDAANQQANAGGGQRNGQPGQGGNRSGQQRGGGNRQGQPQDGQQIAGGGGNGQPGDPNDTNLIQRLMERRAQEMRDQADGETNGTAGGIAQRGGRAGGANYGGAGGAWNGGNWDTLFGPGYVDWTDRLRVVEEVIDVPDLSTDVARIRDRARALRLDYNHLGKKPDWAVITTQIAEPLAEVRQRVAEELLKRQSKDALVPLDRDPVPTKYSELVRRYYEQLGSDQGSDR